MTDREKHETRDHPYESVHIGNLGDIIEMSLSHLPRDTDRAWGQAWKGDQDGWWVCCRECGEAGNAWSYHWGETEADAVAEMNRSIDGAYE